MKQGGDNVDVEGPLRRAMAENEPLTASALARLKGIRKQFRELTSAGVLVETIAVLKEWAELTLEPKVLPQLARSLRRNDDKKLAMRLIDDPKGGGFSSQRTMKKAQRQEMKKAHRQEAREHSARGQSQANAQELQANAQVLSKLEELVAARICRPVRHVRSETVLKSRTNATRALSHHRAYTKHWFEVTGALEENLTPLLDEKGHLVVFVKSASKQRVCEPLEFILSEQRGQGFRAPYFFGSFAIGKLQIAAWESIDIIRIPFKRYSQQDRRRIVEAVAAVNAVKARGTVPVLTKWTDVSPDWFDSKYRELGDAMRSEWKDVYARTFHVLKYQKSLSNRLRWADPSFLTHNDVGLGCSNIYVPPVGDVVLFDWEISTLSVPGADLGLLSRTDSGEQLLSCYVAKMAHHGYELDIDAVRFTLEVLQGFRSLQVGWRHKVLSDVEMALNLLTPHLDT